MNEDTGGGQRPGRLAAALAGAALLPLLPLDLPSDIDTSSPRFLTALHKCNGG